MESFFRVNNGAATFRLCNCPVSGDAGLLPQVSELPQTFPTKMLVRKFISSVAEGETTRRLELLSPRRSRVHQVVSFVSMRILIVLF